MEPSYPEGNFEGNQLLGGSIGLSPLCHTQATQFARQNSDRLPPQFPMASSSNGIVHHLSGPMDPASTRNPVLWTAGPVVPCGCQGRHRRSLGDPLLTDPPPGGRCLHQALLRCDAVRTTMGRGRLHGLLGPCFKTGRGQDRSPPPFPSAEGGRGTAKLCCHFSPGPRRAECGGGARRPPRSVVQPPRSPTPICGAPRGGSAAGWADSGD